MFWPTENIAQFNYTKRTKFSYTFELLLGFQEVIQS